MPSATPAELPDPWRRFLIDVDGLLPVRVQLHCLGGFVLTVRHRLPRTTSDVDYIEVVPRDAIETLQRTAGRGSPLARKHRLYFQHVGVASLPESYAERLTELLPGTFENLKLLALDAHDLALSKLARNHPVDREDIAYLARTVPLHPGLLRMRYREELRPIIIGDPGVHDRTLDMWIEAYM
ncbi:MAG: DUF6036 family nucleotidyltransferase [Gemmatimonadota bacterium]